MTEPQAIHRSTLTEELIEKLDISAGEKVVDGTVNGGGHASRICELIGRKGTLVGIDLDGEALKKAEEKLKDSPCRKHLIQDNFRHLTEILRELSIEKVDKAYFDLGLSSDQLESSGRGFSFRENEPLQMTFNNNPEENLTARDIVNEWEEERIADVIFAYGEEPLARRIAKKIIEERKEKVIETTEQLSEIVEQAYPKSKRGGKLHPARKTFQALRIAVNDELESLREGLRAAQEALSPGGRIAVISFHGLEDREVKNFFKELQQNEVGEILTKKPITPSKEEVEKNPRSSSAKLRVFKKSEI